MVFVIGSGSGPAGYPWKAREFALPGLCCCLDRLASPQKKETQPMPVHRLRALLAPSSQSQPAFQAVSWAGFFAYPSCLFRGLSAGSWAAQQWVYQAAFQEAQAVVRPSLPERDLLATWN